MAWPSMGGDDDIEEEVDDDVSFGADVSARLGLWIECS